MNETLLAQEFRSNILLKISSLDLPLFVLNDIEKTIDKINYYKLSNLHSNMDSFVEYIWELNKNYIKDIKTTFKMKNTLLLAWKPKDELVKKLSNEDVTLLTQNIPLSFWNKFLDFMHVKNYNISNLHSDIKSRISNIESAKFRMTTSIILTISEFINNPMRIKNKLKLAHIKI